MVSSPEEYFSTQDFSPTSSQNDYTPAERLFMMKYLGLSGDDLQNKKLKTTEVPKQAEEVKQQEAVRQEETSVTQSPLAGSEYIQDFAFDTQQPSEEGGAGSEAAFIQTAVESEELPAEPESPASSVSEGSAEQTAQPEAAAAEPSAAQPEAEAKQPETIAEPLRAEEDQPAPVQEAQPVAAQPSVTETAPAEEPARVEPEAKPEQAPDAAAQPVPDVKEEAKAVQPEPVAAPSETEAVKPKPAAPAAAARTDTAPDIRTPLEIAREEFEAVKIAEPALETVLKQENSCQMVAFYIGDQEFVIPTMAMQEVIRFEPPIRIPMAPQFVEGVISLRGRVTPVVNLRAMLEVTNKPLQANNKCIIICMRRGIQLGFVVEKIHTMYWVAQSSLDWGVETQLGINADVDFISAVMKSEDGMRLLGMISVDKIIDYILR